MKDDTMDGQVMQFDVFTQDGATVVMPVGSRLDAEVAGEFRATLLDLIEQGHAHLVVDLPHVDFIDSSGLGALVSALKRLKHRNGAGDIRLTNVQPPVNAVLEIIRLHRVFSQYPTVDAAVQSFG
jgi:anti-sigma B factor antagonist